MGEMDSTEKTEEYVPQEQIDIVVDRFSQLYGIDVDKEKCNFKLELVNQDEWFEKLAEKEIKSAIGQEFDVPKETVDNYIKKNKDRIPFGEWFPIEKKGYVAKDTTPAGYSHTVNHELVHAIASLKGRGFSVGSFMEQIHSFEGINGYGRKNLNEAATEVLAIGLSINSANIEDIGKVLISRYRNLAMGKMGQESVEELYFYMIETFSLVILMQELNITTQELARNYVDGDYKSFAKRVIDGYTEKYPTEKMMEWDDKTFKDHERIKKCANSLAMNEYDLKLLEL